MSELVESAQQERVAIITVQEFFTDCMSAIRDPYCVVMGAQRTEWSNVIAVHPERIHLIGGLVLDISDKDKYIIAIKGEGR